VSDNRQLARLKVWDKNAALEKIGKHLGMFPRRLEHLERGGGPIETAEITLTPMELARRFAFILAEAREQAKQQDKDVEREAS
jgi:hypothetical protein